MRRSERSCSPLPLLLPLAFLVTGCLGYKQVELRDIANVEVEKMDAKGIAVRVDAMIENPNGYRIHVLDPDVDLYLNDKFIGKGVLDTALVLDKKSTRVYSVPLHADLQGGSLLMLLLSGALNGDDMKLGAKGTVVGKAGLIRKRFPFELEEMIEL
ncbi:MAG TPA: LEA type 2 family protein [Flavobacteriales bacterium]|nr:LEA type 2 family protein [Flavobacteriales bacterium]